VLNELSTGTTLPLLQQNVTTMLSYISVNTVGE
jgi:hypothetical protein